VRDGADTRLMLARSPQGVELAEPTLDRIAGQEQGARTGFRDAVAGAGFDAIGRASRDRPDAQTAGYPRKKKSKQGKKGRK
jgi:hypothetical protein